MSEENKTIWTARQWATAKTIVQQFGDSYDLRLHAGAYRRCRHGDNVPTPDTADDVSYWDVDYQHTILVASCKSLEVVEKQRQRLISILTNMIQMAMPSIQDGTLVREPLPEGLLQEAKRLKESCN